MRVTTRRLWLRLHLWIGVAGGALFALLGLTGSALVYQEEILDLLYPEVMRVAPRDEPAPLSRILAAAQAQGSVVYLHLAETRERPLRAAIAQPDGSTRLFLFDPYTAAPLGPLPGRIFPVLFDLHSRLMLGDAGKQAIGWLGLVFGLSIITGIVLWWPRSLRRWRRALHVQWRAGWPRFALDLHKSGGALLALPLLLLALTGAAIVFRTALLPAFGGTLPARAAATSGGDATLDELVAEARRQMPDGRLVFISPPVKPGGLTRIRIRLPGEVHQNGRSFVLLDGAGRTADLQRAPDLPAANLVFDQLPYPLHTGFAFGEAGRFAVFVSGLLPVLLFATGLYLWLRRRKRETFPPQP